jgi:hypothetical protein
LFFFPVLFEDELLAFPLLLAVAEFVVFAALL